MRRIAVPALGIALAVTLAACATPQENPNYQYSTAYDMRSGAVETQSVAYRIPGRSGSAEVFAPTEPVAVTEPAPVYSRVEPGCIDTGACSPVGVADNGAAIVSPPWISPTEEAFDGAATPGAQAMMGELAGGPVEAIPAPVPTPAPEPVREAERALPAPQAMPRREESDSTLTISGPILQARSGTQTRALMHRVEAGDTVYSLSKRYCTDIGSIQEMNGLGADFGVKMGQDLKIPSNC